MIKQIFTNRAIAAILIVQNLLLPLRAADEGAVVQAAEAAKGTVMPVTDKSSATSQKEPIARSQTNALQVDSKKKNKEKSPTLSEIFEQQLDAAPTVLLGKIKKLPLKPLVTVVATDWKAFWEKAELVVSECINSSAWTIVESSLEMIGGTKGVGIDAKQAIAISFYPYNRDIKGAATNWNTILLPLLRVDAKSNSPLIRCLEKIQSIDGEPYGLKKLYDNKNDTYARYLFGPQKLLTALWKDKNQIESNFQQHRALLDHLSYSKDKKGKWLHCIFDVQLLGQCMPIPSLQLCFDTFLKNDIHHYICTLDIEEPNFIIYGALMLNSGKDLANYYAMANDKIRCHQYIKNFWKGWYNSTCFLDFSNCKSSLDQIYTKINQKQWQEDPIAYQIYQWLQIAYPLLAKYCLFAEQNLDGNCQSWYEGKLVQCLKRDDNNLPSSWYQMGIKKELSLVQFQQNFNRFLKEFIELLEKQRELAVKQELYGSHHLKHPFVFVIDEIQENVQTVQIKLQASSSITTETILAGTFGYAQNHLFASNANHQSMQNFLQNLKKLSYVKDDNLNKMHVGLEEIFDEPANIETKTWLDSQQPPVLATQYRISMFLIESLTEVLYGEFFKTKPAKSSPKKP